MKKSGIKYLTTFTFFIICNVIVSGQTDNSGYAAKNGSIDCSICGGQLEGTYTIDIYGNQYHSRHQGELPKCDCCERLISQNLTRGGVKYNDGRNVCKICYSRSISTPEEIQKALENVVKELNSKGLNLDLKRITIMAVDRNDLKNLVPGYSDNIKGYCNSEIIRRFINKKAIGKSISHTLYVLKGINSVAMESIIAHELMHSWIYENTQNDLPAKIREGVCNYISYLYLKGLPYKKSADFITILEKNPDPVYGKGFWEIREKYEDRPISELIAYLKNF